MNSIHFINVKVVSQNRLAITKWYIQLYARNQVKHVAHAKFTLIKTVFQLEKMQAFTVTRLQ